LIEAAQKNEMELDKSPVGFSNGMSECDIGASPELKAASLLRSVKN
jgi:hypothetical protein